MSTSTQLRKWWAAYRCDPSGFARVSIPGPGTTEWQLQVAKGSVAAWEVFADLMRRHAYPFREIAGGTYNCRKIAGSSSWSLHSYGIALDLNPQHNPQGWPVVHNYPQPFIDSVEALETKSGASVFTWGGRWSKSTPPDPMHWQIDCKPADIATGIAYHEEDDVFLPLKEGDGIGDKVAKRSDVAAIQAMLNRLGAGLTEDGQYGTDTVTAVKTLLGGDGKSFYGSLYDDLHWKVAVKAAQTAGEHPVDLDALATAVANDLQIVPKT